MSSSTNTAEAPPLVIIGAGLAGLTLSLGLTRRGIPHKIYESAKEFSEIGAGIALGVNGVTALGLIDPRITETLRKCITYNEGVETNVEGEVDMTSPKTSTWLDFRVGMENGFGELVNTVTYKGQGGAGRACLHRARFLEGLSELIPKDTVTFGKALVSIHDPNADRPEDPLTLKFADGTGITASAVIACDGIKSPTRYGYVLADFGDPSILEPKSTGEFAYRGVYTRQEFDEITNGAISSASGTVWCGRDGYFVMYPIEKGRLMNVVCSRPFPTNSEDLRPPSPSDKNWITLVEHSTMMNDFSGWGAPLRALLDKMNPQRWFLFDHLPPPTFTRGRVALLGDSAHASTPHQGQGANMAFEDSLIMSSILGSLVHGDMIEATRLSPTDIEAAFQAFDRVRRPRTNELVRTSRVMGQMLMYASPDVGDDLGKMKQNLDTRMNWLWDIDLNREIQRGVEIAQDLLHH
ncbi:hypothetical protein BX600DRAFT_473246 [Xylariales sp. PMI_506]|nr:hypothetical protein BX600DRAFT_473246 [Xylariales sp. PMI_506]